MEIISADKRVSETVVKAVILGEFGIGKTSLLHTLPAEETLGVDLEAGFLAVNQWTGDSVKVSSWGDARVIASIIGGIDSAISGEDAYGAHYYKRACEAYPELVKILPKYTNIFVDSITVAGNLCWKWVRGQSQSYNKEGKFDTRAAYGLLGKELEAWFTQLQHVEGKNIFMVALLNKKEGDLGEVHWIPQIDGSAKDKLGGIFDEVFTMTEIHSKDKDGNETKRRGLVTQKINPWGYPAKDRRGTLALVEPANLGFIINKIKTAKRAPFTGDSAEFLADEIIY